MKKFLSLFAAILFAGSMMATDYELVNAASQLEAGAKYVIGSADVTSAVFMGTKDNKNNRVQTPEVAITDGKITLTDTILVLELGGEADAWTFQTQNYHGTNGYLSNASSGTTNACFVQEAAMSFTIAFDGNKAVITSNGGNARNIMRYNSGSKCFACYASGQKDIYLYKEVASQGGEQPVVEPTTKTIYCSPFSEWHYDGARFAVYALGDGENTAWYDLVAVEGAENVYSAEIAEAFPTVIFCRMNGETTENNWDNKWNQTADLTLPTDGKNLYTITGWNENDGEWSVYGEEPVVVEPTLANGFYLIGKVNGVEGWDVASLSAGRKFEGNPENNAEFVLTATLAEGDEIKVVNVLNDAITAWYPEGGNYVIDAAHAGEKDIYFRPDLQGGEDWFGACIYIAANEEPQPVEVDFTKPFTLLFNGTGVSGLDNSSAYAAEVDAIFTAETKGYVASVETAEKVFAGRPIADDNSSLKFGTSSVKGTLAFTLAQEIEVDSIIVNATQYGGTAAEVTVNGVMFPLTQGNKVPTDCKLTPEGAISAITIAQTGSQRIYLRYVKVYPKQAGDEPVVEPTLADGFYLIGKINGVEGWTAADLSADRKFEGNPENNAEFVLTATLAEGDEIKVVNVLDDAITAWYPEGGNYVIDAAHAGEKDIYFRPDLQGGEDWFGACIYIAANEEPVVVELQAVSEATAWDFTKITANTENALYSSNGIKLTDSSTPTKNEEVVYANYSADFMTFAEGFDANTMAFQGEYPIRENKYCQAGTLHFKTTVAGTITVKFSDTGSSASATAVKRYLVVNGEQTEYWTSRPNNGEEPYEAQLNVTSGEIAVPAGDVTITGSSAIRVSNITFAPKAEEPAKFYITGDAALVGEELAWNPDAIKSTETSYKLNLAAGDYKLKVTVDGTWETAKGFNDLTTTADGLTADGDGNICFTLTEAGEVNVHYDGEYFFLNGKFYVAPVVVKYYLKNNWDGGEWSWKEMTALDGGSYMLYNVVVGGEGVNLNTADSDEGASWFTWAEIETFDASFEPATIGALDTVVIYFDPEAVNSFTGANGMSAQILGKYVAPVEEGCDWENIEFLGGPAENANQFKVCKPENVGVVNIQNPNWSEKTQMGIYMTFPSAAFGEISLDEALYEKQGAGILFFLSAFTAQETEFVVNCDGNDLVITVYNANGGTPQPAHTYTVAGSLDVAFGTAWDPTNADNDMEMSDDGIYVWERTELTLPAGTIKFKVCEDHAWTVAYPAQDYELAISEAGIYTIWIHFDPANGNAVTANATKTGDAEVDPTVSVKGSWDEWANELVFVLAEDKQSATLTVNNIATGLYEFKVILNGGDWRSNSHVFTREAASSEGITGNDDVNMKLVADVEGEYTFTWTFATNSLAITFPEGIIPEPVLADGYYLVGDFNDWEPAAEYLFAANEGAEGEFYLSTTLAGGTELKVVYVEADQKVTWFGANNYQIPEELRREVNIYFRPEANAAWTALDGHLYIEKDIQTGIDPVEVDPNAPAVKVLRNGQIFIIKGKKTYNVMGAIVR